jgi:hypothetical protein
MAPNEIPTLIQKGDATRTPLFLLHDAGGTIFNYYKIETIGRPIYAIRNPWLKCEERWVGGASKFVNEYIELIKKVVSAGEILVGGMLVNSPTTMPLTVQVGRLEDNLASTLHVCSLRILGLRSA